MESSNLIKRQMKLIEKRLQRYNLEDILFWFTIQQLFNTYQLKHSFCEIMGMQVNLCKNKFTYIPITCNNR
ncbi:hypothetical protein HYH65_06635 [Clostridium botulinum]|uniref:hypothetical protein n=1 Tax=Clostridium botulinum TaxID=1491 RepID=UPI00059B3C18|nr:hypothetical protein [Clostridium botulinum]KKM42899.1 hypothetical protein VT72_04465 [Clostridium botulinum]MBY6791585.1 hypothetical protein [Clostridium botulinum]MBY6936819.1 hypothetical protein [Clostridium botulinum]MBY6944241.1 hypothetical protein [Clostridium botulinum]